MPYASRRRRWSSPTRSMEAVCYYAYWASTELAEERGRYASYNGQPVGPRHPAAGFAASSCATSAAATSKSTSRRRHGLDALRARIKRARHAQLQLRRHRADRHDLQHHRRGGLDRARVPEHLRQVEPVGRVHGGQRAARARSQEARPLGRSDGRRPQVLRRLARQDRPRAGRDARALRHRVRGRDQVDRRGRRAPPEVDRPGAERSTSTWRARRARSSTRPTSSRGCAASRPRTTCARWRRRRPRSPPARAASSTPSRRVVHGRCAAGGMASARRSARRQSVDEAAPKFCAIDDPTCEACQ